MIQLQKHHLATVILIVVLFTGHNQLNGQEDKGKQRKSKQLTKEQVEVRRIVWMTNLVQNRRFREKFEFTDAQVDKLRDANDEIENSRRELFAAETVEDKKRKYEDYVLTVRRQEKVIESVLVKHQLNSINFFYHIRFVKDMSFFGLTDSYVIEQVEITKKQQKELSDASKEAKEELADELEPLLKKLVEIKRKYREKVLEQLTPEQREIYLRRFGHFIDN